MPIPFKLAIRYLFWRVRKKKTLGLTTVSIVLLIALVGNAITFFIFDQPHHPGLTFLDAIWYSLISISTIGYGDLSATSVEARLGTLFFIVFVGLAAFTAFFGIIVDWFIDLHNKEVKGMTRIYAKDHILIINFPSEQKVKQVINELLQDESDKDRHIVIVADQIGELPFAHPNVSFVRGSPVEEDVYELANLSEAREAIVLCTSADDPNSDSVVASIVSFLEHIKPDLITIAECLSDKHRTLFKSTHCDAIVCSGRIVNNLLVLESQDQGVIRLVDVITTRTEGDTIFALDVGDLGDETVTYIDLAKILLDHSINLLCFNRGRKTFTDFTSLELEAGDRLVYISKERSSWKKIASMLQESMTR